MAKKGKKQNKGKKGRTRAPGPPRAMGVGLDGPALAYANLLNDPCNGKLVHPTYAGGNGGYIIRGESYFSAATGATDTANFLHWTPGAIGNTDSQMLWGNAATATATPAAAALASVTPSKTFLVATASAYRCVAACLKISYVGSAGGLSGRVHFGNTTGGYIDLGTTYAVNAVATGLSSFSRVPVVPIEIKWRPTVADEQWMDPSSATASVDKDRRGAITVAVADLPASVGIFYHLTAVYEWQPLTNQGIQVPTNNLSQSRNTLAEVITSLDRTGSWMVDGMRALNTGARMAASMAQTFGLIPQTMNPYRNQYRLEL